MRPYRAILGVVVLAFAATGCTLTQFTNRWTASPGTLTEPFWCTPTPGTALGAGDCQVLSTQLDFATAFAFGRDHAAQAIAAGATTTGYVAGVGAPFTFVAPPSTFDYQSPDTLFYDGTGATAQVAGLEWNVQSGASAPEGFAGSNDVWSDVGGGVWQLRVWMLRPFQNQVNVFAQTHPCLGAGGPVYSFTDSCYTSTHPTPTQILVSNDDGYSAPGIDAAVNALLAFPNVHLTVSAPATDKSGTGGSTSPDPLTATLKTTLSNVPAWSVDGFPADSVRYALNTLHVNPDLVVTGINNGQNLSLPIIGISGTVGAARAAARKSIPTVALSQGLGSPDDFPAGAVALTDWVTRFLLGRAGPPLSESVVNVNIPTCGATGSVRGTLVVPAATSATGAFSASNCGSTATGLTTDVQGFLNGFVTETSIGTGS
jgi:5'-nucleotidase